MKGLKELTLANFNCTFGEDEKRLEPMLTYFVEVVLPSFKDERKFRGYYFYDVSLKEHEEFGYYLYGRVVKDTVLEIKSRFNSTNQRLEDTNEEYSSSPYSEFILLLKNHRMIFINGQKGSPTLSNLKTLITGNIRRVIKEYNFRQESGNEVLPLYELNLTEITKNRNVIEQIRNFEKISRFSLEFFALNNDIHMDELFKSLQKSREKSKSKTLEPVFHNPEDKEYIANLIQNTNGMANFSMTAKEKPGEAQKVYKNGDFKEKIELYFPEHETPHNNEILAINTALLDARVNVVSKSNLSIYDKIKSKIISLLIK